jgi:hypothetical protein
MTQDMGRPTGPLVLTRTAFRLAAAACLATLLSGSTLSAQQRGRGAQTPAPLNAKAAAPIDLTGYWVAVITEDWRWRMLTPPKGDYASVPVSNEGRRVADSWDLAKDEASGNACKPFGIGNIMRMPGRLHITWQDDDTLKAEFDAGTQTRALHFTGAPPSGGEPTWQGYSAASWEVAGQQLNLDRNGIPVTDVTAAAGGGGGGGGAGAAAGGARGGGGRGGRGGAPRGGSLKVVTTNMRDGYLRKNGVPYSANAVVTEYFDRLGPEPNGDVILIVRTVVEDAKYLAQPFITSTHFKLEANGASKWNPTPCKIDPPVVPGQ